MSKKIPIGEIIKQKLHDNDRSIAWLAKKVNCDSSNFYKKLNNNYFDVDLLFRISEILQEDFFAHYSEMLPRPSYRICNSAAESISICNAKK